MIIQLTFVKFEIVLLCYIAHCTNPFLNCLFIITIEEGLPKLLSVLCQGDVSKNLERNQGLAKLFAELLDFVFEFDHLKVFSLSYNVVSMRYFYIKLYF